MAIRCCCTADGDGVVIAEVLMRYGLGTRTIDASLGGNGTRCMSFPVKAFRCDLFSQVLRSGLQTIRGPADRPNLGINLNDEI